MKEREADGASCPTKWQLLSEKEEERWQRKP